MKNSVPGLSEADDDSTHDIVEEDDDFFDALTEETTELLIKMPSTKKFET